MLRWHATDTIEIADLETGELQGLQLEGYDDWILGLDAVGDKLMLLGSWTTRACASSTL